MRHEWMDEGFTLSLEPSGIHWTYLYAKPGAAGGYTLGGSTGRREVESFLCREILRLAEEVERLKAERATIREDLLVDFTAAWADEIRAKERARLRPRLERCFAELLAYKETFVGSQAPDADLLADLRELGHPNQPPE